MHCWFWSATIFDDFGLYPRDELLNPFSVMLFKALVVAFLLFIALAIAPQAKEGKIESKGRGSSSGLRIKNSALQHATGAHQSNYIA